MFWKMLVVFPQVLFLKSVRTSCHVSRLQDFPQTLILPCHNLETHLEFRKYSRKNNIQIRILQIKIVIGLKNQSISQANKQIRFNQEVERVKTISLPPPVSSRKELPGTHRTRQWWTEWQNDSDVTFQCSITCLKHPSSSFRRKNKNIWGHLQWDYNRGWPMGEVETSMNVEGVQKVFRRYVERCVKPCWKLAV